MPPQRADIVKQLFLKIREFVSFSSHFLAALVAQHFTPSLGWWHGRVSNWGSYFKNNKISSTLHSMKVIVCYLWFLNYLSIIFAAIARTTRFLLPTSTWNWQGFVTSALRAWRKVRPMTIFEVLAYRQRLPAYLNKSRYSSSTDIYIHTYSYM